MNETLPADPYAEEQVIGALLWDSKGRLGVAEKLSGMLSADDFVREDLATIFDAGMRVLRNGNTPNPILIEHDVKVHGIDHGVNLSEVDSLAMAVLVSQLATPQGFESWAATVKNTAARRRFIGALQAAEYAACHAATDSELDEHLTAHEMRLAELRGASKLGVPSVLLGDILGDLRQQTVEFLADPGRIRGISTGWEELDQVTDGLVRSHLWVVGAPTSLGKSQFSHNLVWNLARAGEPLTIWCTEMTALAVARRMQHLQAAVDRMEIRARGVAHLYESERLLRSIDEMDSEKWPVRFITEGRPTVEAIAIEARRDKALRGCSVQIVDHLGQVIARGRDTIERTTNVVAGLKATAMAEGITVVATSQVNRASQTDAPRWARVTDFSNSAGVEQYADVAIGFTPFKYDLGALTPISHFEARDRMARDGYLDVNGGVMKVRDGSTKNLPFKLDWSAGGRYQVAL